MGPELVQAFKYLAAGLCMGIGALGPGFGEGRIGAQAIESMARQPEMANTILRTMIIADAIDETVGIYSLIVAIMILFVA